MRFVLTPEGMVQTTPLGDYITGNIKEKIKEESSEIIKDIIIGLLDGLRDILIDTIYGIALVGGGLFIIFKIAGYKDGYRNAGILFLAYILINYLLGGK